MTNSESTRTEQHWDGVYRGKPSEKLGWFEPHASTRVLVTENSTPSHSVIDVGGGDSRLVSDLLDRGYEDLTVLDVSALALERARSRLGLRAARVEWITADVTRFEPHRTWDLWHDRAVFHFLTGDDQRRRYRAAALRALAPTGQLVVATFARAAPEQCAGLPVCRYDRDSLAAAFEPDFEPLTVGPISPLDSARGDQRPYIGAVFTRSMATRA